MARRAKCHAPDVDKRPLCGLFPFFTIYKHRSGKYALQVFNLDNFVFHFTTRGTDSDDVILLFADQAAGDR
ncbi:hypothetical protein SK44_02209 [Klebsiella aerogenes]|nr:hypothetical protein P851_04134 [Klebsiella aerogenes UCI 48]EUL45464.1 hypothetical protein P850_04134 [Klebsiella aerogenes UCI 47]EUL48705.1 hypothetical protein P849_03840 [Klebsiella aerogenes UCI 46]EUL51354.1 hypothetical protein P848_03904 [Klebsiella aerogenes UCI 45]EUL81383.1 hypothetical protein P830_03623 [Klebsiella aerogenes UCI 27]EUL84507.1 hypothetical protein P831_00643 [Klebsiella aerogenes UCI 28]EUL96827.1 hypothetical protein P819_03542 [Klebsiella aerogenes UCI 16]